MSVNWDWNAKVGEIDVTFNKGSEHEWKTTLHIFDTNCLGCWLKIRDETLVEKVNDEGKHYKTFEYEFMGFFGDEGHMKRCLGITCSYGTKTKSNLFKCEGQCWDEVRLDSNYRYTKTWVRNLMKSGIRVVVDNFVEQKGWDKQYV